jgi:hypothetical protein
MPVLRKHIHGNMLRVLLVAMECWGLLFLVIM